MEKNKNNKNSKNSRKSKEEWFKVLEHYFESKKLHAL